MLARFIGPNSIWDGTLRVALPIATDDTGHIATFLVWLRICASGESMNKQCALKLESSIIPAARLSVKGLDLFVSRKVLLQCVSMIGLMKFSASNLDRPV